MKRARFAAALAAAVLPLTAAAQDVNPGAPPADLRPAAVTLAYVLKRHAVAAGTFPSGTLHTITETWNYTGSGETGTQTLIASGDDYRRDVTIGPFHYADGSFEGTMWTQNANGLTRTMSGVHRRDQIDDAALARAGLPGSGVTLLGQVDSPVRAYVVRVEPKDGRLEYLYYDRSTYLLDRTDRVVDARRVTTTYDDYRTSSGLTMPWRVHRSNGLEHDDTDLVTQSLNVGAPIPAGRLAIPPSARNPVQLSGPRVKLPATISGDRVIVTAQLGQHKVNFQLDSGASEILLDRSVADATGVKSYGAKTEVTAGKYTAADALIPKLQFGDAAMTGVSAKAAPFHTWTFDDAPVAGLLGYDFIAGCVLHIDYYDGTVEAIAPDAFTPPAGAVMLPIRLDDGVPIVSARIGSATGTAFIVDTGADRSMLFPEFATAHPADAADQGLGEVMFDSFPFLDKMSGVGGKIQVRPVQVAGLTIGTIAFPKWLFQVASDAPSFVGEDYDGLIGQDVLRDFDVYFDYAHLKMYLVPNARYKERWG